MTKAVKCAVMVSNNKQQETKGTEKKKRKERNQETEDQRRQERRKAERTPGINKTKKQRQEKSSLVSTLEKWSGLLILGLKD